MRDAVVRCVPYSKANVCALLIIDNFFLLRVAAVRTLLVILRFTVKQEDRTNIINRYQYPVQAKCFSVADPDPVVGSVRK
jgi:hypothetical protein